MENKYYIPKGMNVEFDNDGKVRCVEFENTKIDADKSTFGMHNIEYDDQKRVIKYTSNPEVIDGWFQSSEYQYSYDEDNRLSKTIVTVIHSNGKREYSNTDKYDIVYDIHGNISYIHKNDNKYLSFLYNNKDKVSGINKYSRYNGHDHFEYGYAILYTNDDFAIVTIGNGEDLTNAPRKLIIDMFGKDDYSFDKLIMTLCLSKYMADALLPNTFNDINDTYIIEESIRYSSNLSTNTVIRDDEAGSNSDYVISEYVDNSLVSQTEIVNNHIDTIDLINENKRIKYEYDPWEGIISKCVEDKANHKEIRCIYKLNDNEYKKYTTHVDMVNSTFNSYTLDDKYCIQKDTITYGTDEDIYEFAKILPRPVSDTESRYVKHVHTAHKYPSEPDKNYDIYETYSYNSNNECISYENSTGLKWHV